MSASRDPAWSTPESALSAPQGSSWLDDGSLSDLAFEGLRDRDRYEERGELGAGGMGRVLLAWDHVLGREVALKRPATEAARAVLEREARITARLEHPGIVPVFDAGRAKDGSSWFAMPIVRGRSLAALIREALDSPARHRLLRHVLVVCETVAYAHARGIVHRDLKPANVMIGSFGQTRVIDWSFAHMPGQEGSPPRAGTPRFMSRAQAAGEPPSPADDVFSLGAMLFETVHGQPAFPEVREVTDLLSPTPPRRAPHPPGIPPELAAIIDRALAPDPSERYTDALALAEDLQSYLEGRIVLAHAYTPLERARRFARRWRLPLAVGLAVLLALLVSGAIWLGRIVDARRDAEDSLSLALVTASNAALALEHREDARELARYASALGDHADARGVLMAMEAPAPSVASSNPLPLPDCRPLATLLAPALVLCADQSRPGSLALRELDGAGAGQTRWSAETASTHGARLLSGGELVASYAYFALSFLSGKDGRELARIEPTCRGALQAEGTSDAVLLVRRTCASLVSPAGEEMLPVAACGPSGIAALAVRDDDTRLALACHDGNLHTMSRTGTNLLTYEAHLTPPGLGVSALALLDGERVLVGTQQGSLLTLDVARRERLGLIAPGGYIDSIALDPSRRFALIDQHIGASVLIDTTALSPLARLPSDVRASALGEGGELALAGDTFRREPGPPPRPRFVSVSHGVTSLAFSPDGRHLAVGQSDWLSLIDVATRRPLWRTRWQHEVVKSVVWHEHGTLVAHGIGEASSLWFEDPSRDPELVAPRREDLGSAARRIVALRDGSLLQARWSTLPVRRLLGGVVIDEAVGPAVADLVGLDGGRVVAGLSEDGSVWRGVDLDRGGRFERCDRVEGGLAVTGDPSSDGLLVMRTDEIVGACGSEARYRVETSDDARLSAFAAARGWLVAGSRSGLIRLWRADEPEVHALHRGHSGRIAAIAVSPDGRTFASGGWDARVMFWSSPAEVVDGEGAGRAPPESEEILHLLRSAR